MKRRLEVAIPILLGMALYLILYHAGLLDIWRSPTTLALKYLELIPNYLSPYTSASFEVVTSVIWDQRGFDTFFETSVLFLAVIAAIGLTGLVTEHNDGGKQLTIIPRIASRLLAPVTAVVSASIAVHGHITPGGGFQGGVVFVVAPLMLMLSFSSGIVPRVGFKSGRLMFSRGLALTLIALIGLTPLLYGWVRGVNAYLFQNLAKPDSPFGYPAWVDAGALRVLLSGTLVIFNLLEYVAVIAGFTLALYLLTKMFEEGGDK